MATRSRFQRRHYETVADILALSVGSDSLFTSSEIITLLDRFIEVFEIDNPRFNADRFRSRILGNSAA